MVNEILFSELTSLTRSLILLLYWRPCTSFRTRYTNRFRRGKRVSLGYTVSNTEAGCKIDEIFIFPQRKSFLQAYNVVFKCLQEIVNYKVNVMLGCGMQSNTNINTITQQLQFEVVTGCSLSHGQDMKCPSTEEEGSHRLSPLTAETAPVRPVRPGTIDVRISQNNSDSQWESVTLDMSNYIRLVWPLISSQYLAGKHLLFEVVG